MSEIGDNIKRIRTSKGLTQKQLGDKCNPKMADSAIRRYESRNAIPKRETLAKIADALEVSIFELDGSADIQRSVDIKFLELFEGEITDIELKTANELRNLVESFSKGIIPEKSWQRELLILEHFRKLNKSGELKAIEQIELLSKIPEYQKEK